MLRPKHRTARDRPYTNVPMLFVYGNRSSTRAAWASRKTARASAHARHTKSQSGINLQGLRQGSSGGHLGSVTPVGILFVCELLTLASIAQQLHNLLV